MHTQLRKKLSYAKIEEILGLPDLIETQKKSYEWFKEVGLKELFSNYFPIADFGNTLQLEFEGYKFGEPRMNIDECRDKDMHYAAPLWVKFRLINKQTGEIKSKEILFGDFPLMTKTGSFIINGAERVVVNQLGRAPGIYIEKGELQTSGYNYTANIRPLKGTWLQFEIEPSGIIWAKIEKGRKIAVTQLLKALIYNDNIEMLSNSDFGKEEVIKNPKPENLIDKVLAESITNVSGEVIEGLERGALVRALVLAKNDKVVSDALQKIKEIKVYEPISSILETLKQDNFITQQEVVHELAKKLRHTETSKFEEQKKHIESLFFDPKRTEIGEIGRYKINKRFNRDLTKNSLKQVGLVVQDVIDAVKDLIKVWEGELEVDDIDHLGNRRIKAVGELLQQHLRAGFARMYKMVQERMMTQEKDKMTSDSLINIRPITASINEFFGLSQLSQFMDQTNPLAELTHKRRVSALGPGGLNRDRATAEVRDVHHSHYGRVCPIETPEGPNIGLISSLCNFARVNDYGFIETPYRKVEKGRVTKEIVYLTADEEDKYTVAQANAVLDENGKFVDSKVMARSHKHHILATPEEIQYMDVSPKQIISVSTSLIPFLEHDDANRALMGSNMQRQSVPLVNTDRPLVQTGMEAKVARDTGVVIIAEDTGEVKRIETIVKTEKSKKGKDGEPAKKNVTQIVIENAKGERQVYELKKFARSNSGTCFNQRPIVEVGQKVKKGDVIADGSCTSGGELALGKNVLVAFLPWNGYNFEDAIIVNEKLLKNDNFTSIHIEKHQTEARDTKLGPEEITREIPNAREDSFKDLGEDGIIREGAEVQSDDILVGKITPKGEAELSPEEKLLRAIFGDKAKEARDTSLRVPHGVKGKVIGIKEFSRDAGDELSPGVNRLIRVFISQKRRIAEGDKMSGRHGNKGVVSKIFPEEDMPFLPDGTPLEMVLNPLGVPSRMNIGQILEVHIGWAAYNLGIEAVTPVFDGASENEIKYLLAISSLMWGKKVALHSKETHEKVAYLILEGVSEKELREARGNADKVAAIFQKGKIKMYDAKDNSSFAALYFSKVPKNLLIESYVNNSFFTIAEIQKESSSKYSMQEIRSMLANALFAEETGKILVYDGKTGEPFSQEVTVGYLYVMKLHHLVEDKIHARSTGPYALVTQQPLGGKAQFGGQRFGEMEVWALEAYGAAATLQELLTVKSDDVTGRVATYEAIIKGEKNLEPGVPESFKVLIKELQSLAIDIKTLSEDSREIDLPEGPDLDTTIAAAHLHQEL